MRKKAVASPISGMSVQRDSVKEKRSGELRRLYELERDYTLLKHLNEMLQKVVRFDDFIGITFTQYQGSNAIAIKSPELKIFKLLRFSELHAKFKVWPGMLGDFLRVNGARELDRQGAAVKRTERKFHPLYKPFAAREEPCEKRWSLVDGFWQEVEV